MSEPVQQPGGCIPPGGRHVLLVEDHDLVLASITMQLRKRGFSVVGVSTGTEALKMLERDTFDAVVTEVTLPGSVAGLSLALEVRRRCPKAIVVVMSGYPGFVGPGQSENGAISFLPKPFMPDDLIGILEQPTKAA